MMEFDAMRNEVRLRDLLHNTFTDEAATLWLYIYPSSILKVNILE
jgi:hypothetical protein